MNYVFRGSQLRKSDRAELLERNFSITYLKKYCFVVSQTFYSEKKISLVYSLNALRPLNSKMPWFWHLQAIVLLNKSFNNVYPVFAYWWFIPRYKNISLLLRFNVLSKSS